MTIIRKTVALHPTIDAAVRKCWAILIQNGYDATYSTAVNALILGGWIAPQYLKGDEWRKYFDNFNSFLNDEKTIEEINLKESTSMYGKRVTVRQSKKVEVKTEVKTSRE